MGKGKAICGWGEREKEKERGGGSEEGRGREGEGQRQSTSMTDSSNSDARDLEEVGFRCTIAGREGCGEAVRQACASGRQVL